MAEDLAALLKNLAARVAHLEVCQELRGLDELADQVIIKQAVRDLRDQLEVASEAIEEAALACDRLLGAIGEDD